MPEQTAYVLPEQYLMGSCHGETAAHVLSGTGPSCHQEPTEPISLYRSAAAALHNLESNEQDSNSSVVGAGAADLERQCQRSHRPLRRAPTGPPLRKRTGCHDVSNQVQSSLIDRRPEIRMASFCRDHAMTLLAYGTLLGGLLSEKYLGRPEPRRHELDTASLQNYKNMIDTWGGWTLFQDLLGT